MNVIMVVVKRKYGHLFSSFHLIKEVIVAKSFIKTFQKLHGILKISVNDKNPIFTRYFWIDLFSCLGTYLVHISSHCPQYDRKIDIVNKCIEGYEHLFLFDKQM